MDESDPVWYEDTIIIPTEIILQADEENQRNPEGASNSVRLGRNAVRLYRRALHDERFWSFVPDWEHKTTPDKLTEIPSLSLSEHQTIAVKDLTPWILT